MHVQIEQITKVFGTLRANDSISMALDGGRIYAILGENGAGKSTLMKILSGYQPPDSGQIMLDGTPVKFATPADALRSGIGMLHQEPLDIAPMTALDNFILGRPTGLLPNRRTTRRAFADTIKRLGFALDPDAYIDTLTIGERQQLEITRLISLGARFLILDEPTTGISAGQKEQLFQTLRDLAKHDGLTVALVSHKLEDVEALCDHVFVLRAGKLAGNAPMPLSPAQMVDMMFGKRLDPEPRPAHHGDSADVLRLDALRVHDERLTMQPVSLNIQAGQVVGLAGLDGSGQRAFLRVCAGLEPPLSGRLFLKGEDVTALGYHERARCSVAFAAAGRLEEGLIAGLTLSEHFALAQGAGRLRVDMPVATAQATAQIERYSVRGRPDSRIETLSGGNQQRVLLSMLPESLALLLLENPTRGLDVDSARSIWARLLARREQGTAILFISPDLDEIVQYSDRIAVFYGGRVTVIDDPSSLTAAQLGQLIGGIAL